VKVYVLVALIAAAVTYLSVPVVRHIALVANALSPVRSRDVHVTPVPRLGGLAMYAGFTVAITVASHIPYLAGVMNSSAWAVVLGAGLVCLLGVIDDLWELDWMTKLAGQVLAAGVMAWKGVQLITFPIGGLTIGSANLSLGTTIVVVLVAINAVNFIDGLDGLAAGVIGIGATAFFLYVYVLTRFTSPGSFSSQAATLVCALIGICVGFLPHNFNPATIFMGDSGSMQLGLISAAVTIIVTGQVDPASLPTTSAVGVFLPIIIPVAVLLLPLTDMVMAVVRRTRAGLSPFHPDRMHMHHRLLARGHSHRRAVLVMYMWTAITAFSVASLSFFPAPAVGAATVGAVLVAVPLTSNLVPGLFLPLPRSMPGRHAPPRTGRRTHPAKERQ